MRASPPGGYRQAAGDTARRVLLAGVGNVFLCDDGFGVEVIRRLDTGALPAGVHVADYGIRGIHLAYDLLDESYDSLVMVDAAPVGGPPGTLAVIEAAAAAGPAPAQAGPLGPPAVDSHSMHPQAVLGVLRMLGGWPGRVLVVGCQPAELGEGMGLSAPVRSALAEGVRLATVVARAEAAGGFGRDTAAPASRPAGVRPADA